MWTKNGLNFICIFLWQITDSTCTFRTPLNADAHDQCGGDEKAGLQCRKVSQFCDEEYEWHCNRYDLWYRYHSWIDFLSLYKKDFYITMSYTI